MRSRRSHGATLVELIVTLAVMGLLATLAAAAVAALRSPRRDGHAEMLAAARAKAIRIGHPVKVEGAAPVLFLPDGRAVGRGVDPLTGIADDTTQ